MLALAVFVLAPITAEYITGYDSSTGDPLVLLGSLLIFAPLYGGPALLIRETARRTGMAWPGLLALAVAFGVLQAGIIDQSLFSDSYRQIEDWDETFAATYVPGLGVSAANAVNFLAGHAIWSFAVPIALVEGLRPELAGRPWLRLPGIVVVTLLFGAAAALVLGDMLTHEQDHASAAQLIGSAVVIVLLIGYAMTLGRRRAPRVPRRIPRPWVLAALSLVAAFAVNLVPQTWWGVAAAVAVLAGSAAAIAFWARSVDWSGVHVVALASGALVARTLIGFLVTPLGDVPVVAKVAHIVFFLVGGVLLGVLAWRRSRSF